MAILILGAILLVLGIIAPLALYFYRRYQDAKIEKMRRVAQLTHAYRLTQRFLYQIPAQYLTRESKLLLLERSIAFLEKLRKESPGSQVLPSKIFRNQALLDELQKNFVTPPKVTLKTAIEARQAQLYLAEFSRFIEIQARANAIDQSAANQLVPQVNWYAIQSVTDFYREQGDGASKMRQYRLAIHHYHNAINEFNKHLEFEKAEEGVAECQKLIAQNEPLLESQESGRDIVLEEEHLLVKGLDTMDQEGDEVKKKQLYE